MKTKIVVLNLVLEEVYTTACRPGSSTHYTMHLPGRYGSSIKPAGRPRRSSDPSPVSLSSYSSRNHHCSCLSDIQNHQWPQYLHEVIQRLVGENLPSEDRLGRLMQEMELLDSGSDPDYEYDGF